MKITKESVHSMIPKSRFSISSVMVVVVLLAVDFAIIRFCMYDGPLELALAVLPSSNILLLSLPLVRPGEKMRQFWVVFQVLGWMLLLGVSGLFLLGERNLILAPIDWIDQLNLFENHGSAELSLLSVAVIAFYMSPQLLVAWAVAWLTVRDRPVIKRAWSEFYK